MSSIELLEDACARLPHTTRKMFGGHGLFAPNGGMFAGIVDDDRIILKLADDTARSELCALGTEAWTYHGKTGDMTMKDWILVPDAFYDEPQELQAWAERAHRLAPAKKAKPTPKKAKPVATKSKVAPKKAKPAASKSKAAPKKAKRSTSRRS